MDVLLMGLFFLGLALVAWLLPALLVVAFGILAVASFVGGFVWWRDSKRKAPGVPP